MTSLTSGFCGETTERPAHSLSNGASAELGLLFRTPSQPAHTNVASLVQSAFSLYRKQDYQGAAECLRQAVALEPTNYEANLWLGHSCGQLEEYEAAAAAFETAIQCRPDDSAGPYWLGATLYRQGRYQEAVRAIQQSLARSTNQPAAWATLGNCQYLLGRLEQAVDAYRQSTRLEPTNFDGFLWCGYGLMRLGRVREAASSFGEAARLRPTDFDANLWQGLALLRLKSFAEATTSLERARASKPANREVRWLLLAGYLGAGQTSKIAQLHLGLGLPVALLLGAFYLPMLVLLLRRSLRLGVRPAPGFGLVLSWYGVMMSGESVFAVVLLLLCARPAPEALGVALCLAALPVVAAARWGFARQPWGAPFAGPPRVPSVKLLCWGIAVVVGALLLCAGYGWLVQRITGKPMPPQFIWAWLAGGGHGHIWLMYLGAVVAAPAMEEILFRGLLFGALEQRLSSFWTVVVSAALFSAAHFQLSYFVPIFILGLAFGWARHKSGGLLLPWAMHGLMNLISVSMVLYYLAGGVGQR